MKKSAVRKKFTSQGANPLHEEQAHFMRSKLTSQGAKAPPKRHNSYAGTHKTA